MHAGTASTLVPAIKSGAPRSNLFNAPWTKLSLIALKKEIEMNVRVNVAWLLACAAGLGMYGPSLAQEATTPAAGQPLLPPSSSAASPLDVPAAENPYAGSIPGMPRRVNAVPSIRQAAEAVRDAEAPAAKTDAQAKLTDSLAKYFDDDMKRWEKELTEIEQRLAKLRELLDHRRNSKQEIIELQAKVALNEAEELGFYDDEHAANLPSSGTTTFGNGLAPSAADPAQMRAL
jgi:hypothetical protein